MNFMPYDSSPNQQLKRTEPLIFRIPSLLLLFILLALQNAWAGAYTPLLQPTDIAVVVNTSHPDSKPLALYYMQKRFIPWRNLVTVETTTRESCSRSEYEKEIAAPVRDALNRLNREGAGIRCIVLMRGMPLKIRQGRSNPGDSERLENLKNEKKRLTEERIRLEKTDDDGNKQKKLREIRERIRTVTEGINSLKRKNTRASVDSELSLVRAEGYPVAGWLPNPLFSQFPDSASLPIKSSEMIMVSRIDGPDAATARRIIDDSIYAEEHGGLHGTAYFDARWKLPEARNGLSGYALYDAAIHNAANIVRKSRRLRVVIDSRTELFAPGTCNNAAIYCGWYSLANYVDAFKWVRGAVGYHIASAECTTLRRKDSNVWCKKMLEKGVAATLGPVYEPYVQAFPLPDIFFSSLIFNGSTIAEAYWYSIPFTSWQMVLVADPLYRPFLIHAIKFR